MDQVSRIGRAELDGTTPDTPALLQFFDHIVLGSTNEAVWRCETTHLLDQYGQPSFAVRLDLDPHAGNVLGRVPGGGTRNHLVELHDRSVPALEAAARRLLKCGTESRAHYGTVLRELPLSHRSNSIGASLLTNCLPVTWAEKGCAFQRVADTTGANGVFFGAITLAAPATILELTLAAYFPALPLFDEARGAEDGLRYALGRSWSEVSITRVGQTVFWTARQPRRLG
ncbi:hypothetical protein [Nocardia brasiliensis]|uniref:hypothetical protein n=1 Tax=Nocardia brasiliensis TaxID=37326 RepID=UPI0024573C2D|nr:hypothetical protein [Nocardia brasiliensis]